MIRGRAGRLTACVLSSGLLSAAWFAPACAPPPPAGAADCGDTIILLSARAFDGSDRVARQLEAMAAASDVLGPARFLVVEPADGDLAALAGSLETARDPRKPRAIVALLGDLSFLDGLDPSVPDRGPERLTSRRVAVGRLQETVHALQARAQQLTVPLVLATAPLGMQGRIEVPELLSLADTLRDRLGAIDLGAAFHRLEPAPLFSNGIDRLDAFGHDELARALYTAFLPDPGPLPPRDEAERAARAEARALAAFHEGDFEAFAREGAAALAGAAPTPRHAMRRAAIAAAWRGPDAGVEQLAGVDPGGDPIPGLALWHALRGEPHEAAPPEDPFEASLVAILRAVARDDPAATALAEALVDEAPHRLEAWVVDHLARTRSPTSPVRLSAVRRQLGHFPRTAVADRLSERLLDAWPATLTALPAVYLASRPLDVLQPTGPILEAARRRARFGYTSDAFHLMRKEMGTDRFPRSWLEAREAWAPH